MKKILIWLAASTAALVLASGCSKAPADTPKTQTSDQTSAAASAAESVKAPTAEPAKAPAAEPVSKPEPPAKPPYTLDRTDILEEANTEVAVFQSESKATYEQVLDEAEKQGDAGDVIYLTDYRLTIPQIKDLTARCADRRVLWAMDVDGITVTPAATELDLSGHNLAKLGIDLYEIFPLLPRLTRIDICKTGFNNEQYAALQDAFPDIRMIWEIVWSHWTFRTDVVAFSTLKFCSDPFFLYDDEAQYLRYCTDLVALDLGHNRVHDWSFLQYMPNLKILIAVDNQVEDLSWIKYTPKLEYLEFFVGRIKDLSFLQYTPNMVDLNISYNPESDATYLYNLPKLERLWMEHTRIPYSEFEKLQKTYPNAKIVYNGTGSIDQGWRTHPRFFAMRDMFRKNYVHELFMDKEDTVSSGEIK